MKRPQAAVAEFSVEQHDWLESNESFGVDGISEVKKMEGFVSQTCHVRFL